MRQHIKQFLFRVNPRLATSFFSERARAHSHRIIESWGCHHVDDILLGRFGDRVMSGPFRGLTLSPMTRSEQLGPYLLGLYERELYSTWECIFSGSYVQIVDIGAKLGYYAVGLAQRYPVSRVIAFDTDRWARRVLKEMVRVNGTPNVEVRGYCDPSWLAANLAGGALIVSDCEGYERDLFCSVPIPNLASATFVIEVHEALMPGVTERLWGRLGSTHCLTEICTNSEADIPFFEFDLSGLNVRERSLAKQEVRPPQAWLFGLPREGPNRSLRGLGDPTS
jgi:hypothetical protein